MRALVSSPSAPHIELRDVPEPEPLPHQALVDVKAVSLNRGEVKRLTASDPGIIWGWDLAGIVTHAAADGSGPSKGARVVGLMNPGAWAQRAAVRTNWLAELPDGTSFEQAASLPVAGLTALRALEVAGFVLDKRVLAGPRSTSPPPPTTRSPTRPARCSAALPAPGCTGSTCSKSSSGRGPAVATCAASPSSWPPVASSRRST